jgi:hypothetical protein
MGEGSGTSLVDSSGNGHTQSNGYQGGVTWVAGLLAGDSDLCADFNGSSQHAYCASAAWMNVATITAEALFQADVSTGGVIVGRNDYWGGSLASWDIRLNASSKLVFRFWTTTAGPYEVVGATTIATLQTHHVAVTYDGTTARLYLDGAQDGSLAQAGSLRTGTASVGIAISNEVSQGTNRFNGRVDEVAYYGTALSATRVSAHYAAATATPASASGTASLSLSASGGAGATGGGSASLSLSASGSTSAPAGGSASLILSASGALTPPTPASGSATLSLSASGGASGSPGGSASLNLIATGTALAVMAASGSATLTLTASGSAVMSAGGTAVLTLTAGGVAYALYETDTSNALDGLDLLLTATVIMPVAIAPAPVGAAERYDVSVPYPVPVLNGGRVE